MQQISWSQSVQECQLTCDMSITKKINAHTKFPLIEKCI